MDLYTKQETESLPLTIAEAEGYETVARGNFVNLVRFWLFMTVVTILFSIAASIPSHVLQLVNGYFDAK